MSCSAITWQETRRTKHWNSSLESASVIGAGLFPISGDRTWVGWDSQSGKPVYIEPLGADAELLIENTYDNQSAISLASGSAKIRIGDSWRTWTASANDRVGLSEQCSFQGCPEWARNRIAMPAYTSSLRILNSVLELQNGLGSEPTWLFLRPIQSQTGYLEKGYQDWPKASSRVKDSGSNSSLRESRTEGISWFTMLPPSSLHPGGMALPAQEKNQRWRHPSCQFRSVQWRRW